MSSPLIEIIQRKYVRGTHPAMKPKDAASMILIDSRGIVPKVLMGKRNPAAKFMPGFYVFPGGRLEKGDGDAPHQGALPPQDIERLRKFTQRPTERRMRALALAAIRETFEETGLRIGAPSDESGAGAAPEGWAEFLAGGRTPTLEGVRFIGRAITPPGRNRRFDTRFFLRDVSRLEDLKTVKPTPDSELVDLVWVPINDAGAIEAVEITHIILGELRKLIAGGFAESLSRPMFRMRNGKFERIAL